MAAKPVTSKRQRWGAGFLCLQHFIDGDVNAGTDLARWIVPISGRIVDIIAVSRVAGTGGGSTILDIHKNGTTIFTTQANRPTLEDQDSGMYTAGAPEVPTVRAGDILSLDVDAVNTSSDHTDLSIAIIIEGR